MGGLQRTEEIYSSERYVVYLARQEPRGRAVVVKTPARGREDAVAGSRLRREYELLTALDVPGVVKPLDLQEVDAAPALLLEPAGASDLGARLKRSALSLSEFLDLAVQMTTIVGRVHRRNIVHRDLSPAKFVLDESGRVTLVGFELATTLSGHVPLGELEGTLPYMAPEQTGRMRRAVDHRADLYALGATFYEMLAGNPPFPSFDPAEVVHAHLAARPASPSLTNPAVPNVLSAIALKLLAKMPEDRYQSAEGLLVDLRDARKQWRETAAIRPFLLGREDLARQLSISGRLFGRERELNDISAALSAAAGGEKQFVLVGGKAGIGKSALIERLAQQVERPGRFAAGKCDQLHSNEPMAALLMALRGTVADLLAQGPEARALFRQRVQSIFDHSGRLLTDLLPDLERLVGPQSPLEELGPAERENRLFLLLSAFVGVLAADAPFVLFLDDLQWADASTLKLLEHLAADPQVEHLLMVGAYRSEEVGPALTRALERVRAAGVAVTSLELGPLDVDAVTGLLVETLRSSPEQTASIARVVHEKTAGNPLFIQRLLRFLWQSKLFSYDRSSEAYAWNGARIAEVPVSENVADLLIAGMRRLPEGTRGLLEVAACIGTRFDLRELAQATGCSDEDVGKALWSALHEGFIVPVEETRSASGQPGALIAAVYRFAHDRVQEAAYALFDEAERQSWHLRIGRSLLALPTETVERRIFDIVDHLNRGAASMTPSERQRLADLNLRAGRRAKGTAAYASAYEYLSHGLHALLPGAAASAHALWFDLHREAAESAYLIGQHARSEALIGEALAHAATDLERAALISIRTLAATARGCFVDAVAVSRQGLQLFGVVLPESDLDAAVDKEFALVESALGGRSPSELMQLPTLSAPNGLACLRLLANAMTAAYYFDQRVFTLFALRTFRFCLQHGASQYMPRACADFGLILATRGDYARAHEFGRLALELSHRVGNRSEEAKVLFIFGLFNHWREPLRTSVQLLRTAYARGIATGEFQGAGIAAAARVQSLFTAGVRLDTVLGELESCHAFIRQVDHRVANHLILPYRQAVRCLKGHTRSPLSFEDEQFSEAAFIAAAPRLAVAFYGALRMQVSYVMGDYILAEEMAQLSARQNVFSAGFVQQADANLYAALTRLARGDSYAPEERGGLLLQVAESRNRLERWAENAPGNFRHKLQLLCAEQARLEGMRLVAARLYEDAIAGAQREGFLQDAALAHERYGRFCLTLGLSQSASTHLGQAISGYTNWGAVLKARSLETEFASLGVAADTGRRTGLLRSRVAGSGALDLDSLLEAADTLTAELVLPRLLDKLLRLSLELAGAERGALVVDDGGTALVRASGTSLGISLDPQPLARSEELPRSIVEHVLRTSRPVVLGDASREGGFAADPFVGEHGVKSVLAVPVRRAARSVGVLYLENNLATEVFTPERVQTFELLSGQIGAALDNAMLVQQLEDEVAERKRKEAEARFLADVSAALAESLDYETTLSRAARLAVPAIADMCLIDVVEGNEIKPMAMVHADAELEALLHEYRRIYPVSWDGPQPASHALRTGRSLLIPEVSDDTLAQFVHHSSQGRLLRTFGLRSVIATPLIARGRTLGAISLGSTATLRYGPPHVAAAEEFAQRVALAIDNARLYRLSEDAVHARDEFLSIASHELRTPVASLQLAVEGITKGVVAPTPEMFQRTSDMIKRQVARLAKLIEQLLSVSRIQAGRVVLQREEVDLSAAVRSAVAQLGDTIARSGSQVSVHAEQPVVGRWDLSALEQVATNLLTNAVKFGQKQPITVTVEKVGDKGRLVVEDHGIGIPEERLPRIFERFERAVSAREYGGLGLGLFIARSIVDALGGNICVHSRSGAGATFSVELPCTGALQGVAS